MIDRNTTWTRRRVLGALATVGLPVSNQPPFAQTPLPGWAREIDCENWAQYFLKFVVSHPAVTCAIPATSKTNHMSENMGALYGRLPDPDIRRRMVQHFDAL